MDEDPVDGMLGDTQMEALAQTLDGISQRMKFSPPRDTAAYDESVSRLPEQTECVLSRPGTHLRCGRQDPENLFQRDFRVDLDMNRDTAAGKAKTLGSQTLRP